jgi:group I intron endonuclease
MYNYFNVKYLSYQKNMPICISLLKYGYSKFSLTILEYCEPSKCLEREGYYFKLLQPEYNICLDPTALMFGRSHSDESRKKISDAKKGENHHMFGKKHSEKTITKMAGSHKGLKAGENNPMYGKPRPEGAGRPSQAIEVIDKNNNDKKTYYNSIREAERALNISR